MDDLLRSLGEIGLGRHECRVYAALLEQSPAGAAWIAKRCNMSRSSVYTTLQSLADRGLVGTTHRNEVKQFVAQGHAALMDMLEKEQRRANERLKVGESLRERFASMAGGERGLPRAVFFEGVQGLRRIYLGMIRNAKPGATMHIVRDEFVWTPAWRFVFEDEWHARVKRLKTDKKLSTRLLVNRSREERSHRAYYETRKAFEFRMLPARFAVRDFAMYLVDDMVGILSFRQEAPVGIQITDATLSRNFATLFSALWDLSSRGAR